MSKKIPSGWATTPSLTFCTGRNKSFNPKKEDQKNYVLYSVPSHATGKPEILHSKEIGSNKQFVSEGDVLISKINPHLNRTWVVENHEKDNPIASTEWIVFQRNMAIQPRFLSLFLRQGVVRDFLCHNASGVGGSLTRIKPAIFGEVELSLPPLAEQKRIVTKIEELFSELDAGEESFKQARKQLGIYRQSLLKQAFEGKLTGAWRKGQITPLMEEWTEVELADITQIIDPNPSHRYPSYAGGKIPLLATKQMEGRDGWDPSSAKLTTEEFYQQRVDKHGFDESDVIFARKGRLGLARKPPKFPKYAFSHTVFIVRPSGRISSDYLLWVLRPDSVVSWLMAELNTGAGVPTLGKGIFGRLPIHLPPLGEQQEIIRLIEEQFTVIEQNEREIDAALKRSEALRQSILKRAFSGQLVPQDPTDEPASQLLARIQAERTEQEAAEATKKTKKMAKKKTARKRAKKS